MSEAKLQDHIARLVNDPLNFVRFVYPWGEPGALAPYDGPDTWQTQFLQQMGRQLNTPRDGALRMAVSSGHGTGKSALVSWIIQWFISTRPHPQIVCTANTRDQLMKKLWRELSVWHKRAINSHWHQWTATKFYNIKHPETWFASATPWSKENSEAFAGTHAPYTLMIFDEASAIDDIIWDVAEGATTTTNTIWLVLGNMTRNSGRFFECFNRFKHRWTTMRIDSRTARMTDKAQLQQWIDDYGEDSDFVRVRIKGECPRAGSTQFIPSDVVERAMRTKVLEDPQAVRVLGVDVARFGDDQSIILRRIGTKVPSFKSFRGVDTMTLSAYVAEEIEEFNPDMTFVDGTGLGAGVVDRLRQLNYTVIDVIGKSKPDASEKYVNKRAECFGRLRDWLKGEVELPDHDGLKTALISIEYGYSEGMTIMLEKKDDMKKRGLASPDEADALALTFAEPVRAHRQIILPPEVLFRRQTGECLPTRRFGRSSATDWRLL